MADETLVRSVEARASVSGTNFRVTDIEVNRNVGVSANHAKIKGIVDDIGTIALDDDVAVEINGHTIFRGTLKKAVESEDGIITIDAYDRLINVQNKQVRLNLQEPREAYTVLQDILDDADLTNVDIAPKSEMVANEPLKDGFGSADRGEPLSRVLRQLTDLLHAIVWVDRENTIRIEPYPEHRTYEVGYVLELEAGEDSNNTERVVVKGGTSVGSLGPAASRMYAETSPSSFSERTGDDGRELTIDDQNVITQDGANAVAASNQYRQGRQTNPGEVTIVGNVDVELFDSAIVPNLQALGPLGDGQWTIKGLQHTINTQDGFRTRLTLTDTPQSQLSNVSGPAGDLSRAFLTRVENREEDVATLDAISGFTGDLMAESDSEAQTDVGTLQQST